MAFLQDVVLTVARHWIYVLASVVVIRLAFNRYKAGLSDIPGPFLASLTDLWSLIHYIRRNGREEYRMHEKYNSPLLRLGPNTISVSDPEAVRIIYGWKPVFNKSRLYISQMVTTANGTALTNISSTRDEAWHARLRRPVANSYSMSSMVEYEPLVDSTSRVFFKQMEERFVKIGEECPLSRWLQMYAFDIIGELTFSKRFGFLESGNDMNDMMHHTGNAMDYIGIVGQIPTLDEYLRIKGFGHILRKFRPTGPLMRFTASQIRAHKLTPDSTRPDFLTRFIAAKEKYPDVMTDNQLATYTNTNISAGSDTTAIALREVIYRLLMHPQCHAQFMTELKAVLQARGPSYDRASPITWAETQRSMPYFQAVIKECLRIHPPLGQLIPREVPDGGTTLCGRFIPGGTVVGCNAWTLHRSRALYGPDADEFRPERWVVDDEDAEGVERVRNMENLNFAFGGGPRVCIGKNIAMLEICKVVPEFFRRFNIQMVDSGRYYLRPGWLVLQEGLDVFLKLRDPGELEGSFGEK